MLTVDEPTDPQPDVYDPFYLDTHLRRVFGTYSPHGIVTTTFMGGHKRRSQLG